MQKLLFINIKTNINDNFLGSQDAGCLQSCPIFYYPIKNENLDQFHRIRASFQKIHLLSTSYQSHQSSSPLLELDFIFDCLSASMQISSYSNFHLFLVIFFHYSRYPMYSFYSSYPMINHMRFFYSITDECFCANFFEFLGCESDK